MIIKPKPILFLGFLIIISGLNGIPPSNSELGGWDIVWQDEFNDSTINSSDWEFDIGTGAPVFDVYGISSPLFIPEGFPKDNFSVRWKGKLKTEYHLTTPSTPYQMTVSDYTLMITLLLINGNLSQQESLQEK